MLFPSGIRIGDRVRLNVPDSKILHGLVCVVTDVIRSCFDANDVIGVEVKIGTSECMFSPEDVVLI